MASAAPPPPVPATDTTDPVPLRSICEHADRVAKEAYDGVKAIQEEIDNIKEQCAKGQQSTSTPVNEVYEALSKKMEQKIEVGMVAIEKKMLSEFAALKEDMWRGFSETGVQVKMMSHIRSGQKPSRRLNNFFDEWDGLWNDKLHGALVVACWTSMYDDIPEWIRKTVYLKKKVLATILQSSERACKMRWPIRYAKAAGFVEGLAAAGYACSEFKEEGYTLSDVKEAGYTAQQVKAPGHPLPHSLTHPLTHSLTRS